MSDALDPYWSRVRDGEPVALAALCNRWARPVFAYCEHVASSGQGVVAASRALGQFRAAGAGLYGAAPRDAEAILRRITRRAAIACEATPAAASDGRHEEDRCPGRGAELVARVEDALSPAALRMLDEHVAECDACCALRRRLEAGERAFKRPPRVPLPAAVVEEVVLALVYAAPLRPHTAEPNAVRADVLRLFALTAGAPTHSSAAAGMARLERPKIARARTRRGPDRRSRSTRAQRPRQAAGKRSRGSSLLLTAVAVALSSGGMMIINSWSADDSSWRSTPEPSHGAEFGAPRTTNLRQPQHVSGGQGVRRTSWPQPVTPRRSLPPPPPRATALR